jgi:hypothetical protein
MYWLFPAVVESLEEAVLNSLFRAETVVGRDGHARYGLPVEKAAALVHRYIRREKRDAQATLHTTISRLMCHASCIAKQSSTIGDTLSCTPLMPRLTPVALPTAGCLATEALWLSSEM